MKLLQRPPGVTLHPHQNSLTSISINISLANTFLMQIPDLIVVLTSKIPENPSVKLELLRTCPLTRSDKLVSLFMEFPMPGQRRQRCSRGVNAQIDRTA